MGQTAGSQVESLLPEALLRPSRTTGCKWDQGSPGAPPALLTSAEIGEPLGG